MGRNKSMDSKEAGAKAADEEEEEITITTFLTQQLDKFFINHIPVESVQELPPGYLYYAGAVAYVAAFSLFAYFVYSSYDSAIKQAFIAVDDSSGVCETVPISITANYLADDKGNWEGSPQFGYSLGKYGMYFNNFEVSSFSQYQQMMNVYNGVLHAIGQLAQEQNLPFNLLLWISFIHYYSVEQPLATNFTSIGYGQLQYLQMTGSAQEIYNLPNQLVNSGDYLGSCPVHALTTFDPANALISTNLNYKEFMNYSTCYYPLPPDQWGYSNTIDDGIFRVMLNVETFSMAMSLNMGFLKIDDLTSASTEQTYLHFHNATYILSQYYEERNLMMDPMWCIYNVTVIPVDEPQIEYLCFYTSSRSVALPVMHHLGASFQEPSYCDCATIGKSSPCNDFNLISGLMFYPVQNSLFTPVITVVSQQITYLLTLLAGYDSYRDFNYATYNASWTLAAAVYNRQDDNYTTRSWYEEAFAFANIEGGLNGSLLVFNSYDTTSHLVSEYKYSLENGSCVDSFTISDEYWDKLSDNSPVALVQDYYKCYPTHFNAFFNALGIASGNTQLAVPLIVVLLLPMLYGFLNMINYIPAKEEYNKLEKEEAIDILALILLRLRDGKSRGVKPKGVLMTLTKELIAAAKEEGGFPDSDDEQDYDEDEGAGKAIRKSVGRRGSTRGKRRPGSIIEGDAPAAEVDSDDEYGGSDEDIEANKPVKKASKKRQSNMDIRMSTSRNSNLGTRKRKKERQRMGLFVKQLDVQEDDQPTRATKRSSNIPTAAAVPVAPAPAETGFFSYFFGGSAPAESRETNSGLEMENIPQGANNPMQTTFLDIITDSIPYEIQIMNNLEDKHGTINLGSKKVLKANHLEPLVDDLLRNFMEAMNSKDDDGNSGLAVAKESPAYTMGCSIAKRLAQVDFDSFLSHENPVLHLKLANALCMNASIELFCEMRQIESQFADRIAYNIGNKVVTAAALSSMVC